MGKKKKPTKTWFEHQRAEGKISKYLKQICLKFHTKTTSGKRNNKIKLVKSLFEDSAHGDGQDNLDIDKLCILNSFSVRSAISAITAFQNDSSVR